MKTFLVTGGLGFLGSSLVRALVREGHRVRVFDNGSRGAAKRLGDDAAHVEIVQGDIRDAEAVRRVVKGVDTVCHLAYVNGTRFFYERPEYVLDVGVKGMIHVLDACLEFDVGELVLTSSSEVYQTPPAVPTDEKVPLVVPDLHNPRFSYGGGKIISELMAVHYGKAHFERVLIVRPHNVYGPDMGWEHVIPEFVLRMRALCQKYPGGPIRFPVQGTGKETRAFVFVEDFTEGLHTVIRRGGHLNVYNIGTAEEICVETLAREVGRYFGREIVPVPGTLRPGSTPRRCPDVRKLEALGFRPRYSFQEGLRRTVEWYDQNAHLCPIREEK